VGGGASHRLVGERGIRARSCGDAVDSSKQKGEVFEPLLFYAVLVKVAVNALARVDPDKRNVVVHRILAE
jgi:hypothetical protein